ncbi:MAG: GHKL domain-containing protein, partial [Candidatus Lokiarchaeota archaeon]|nr:GHKL domain-containing protein [Candidatus Lokiarchaeota archaeon]
WFFHNEMGTFLEAELSKRLESIARISAHNIEITPGLRVDDFARLDDNFSSDYYLIQSKLRSLKTQNELQGVYIVDTNLNVILDESGNFPAGTRLTYIEQDSAGLFAALTGNVAVSPIHVIEGNRFKTAYAPLTNIMAEISALLVLEANADFFSIIRVFRRGLIITGVASIAAIILFSVFLSWTISLLINTQQSLRKTEKLALLGQMAASVAHEIRNPLGIIKATSDVVKLKYQNKEEPDELFDYIGKEVMRLNNLVNDFLTFAREIKLNEKPGNIRETVEKAVNAFEREHSESEITLTMTAVNDLPEVTYDEEKIQQVLLNLLMNAAQAMENKGEISLEIEPHFHAGKQYVRINIIDNGCGIEGDVQKVFDPFYTTKSSGSGLGLAITRQIIEKHNGWIDIASEPGKGTTVRIYLPV